MICSKVGLTLSVGKPDHPVTAVNSNWIWIGLFMKNLFVWIALLLLAACKASPQVNAIILTEALPDSEGELLYLDLKCPACHGYQGAGDGFLSTGLRSKPIDFSSTEAMGTIPDDQLKDAIWKGKGEGMPGFPRLTGHQVEALVAYIRSISQSP